MYEGVEPADKASTQHPDLGAFTESSFLWPDEDDPAWFIRLWWSLVDGRYEVTGFEMGPAPLGGKQVPLTATLLRSVPLGTLIEEGRRYQIAYKNEMVADLEGDQEFREMFSEHGSDPDVLLRGSVRELEVLTNPPARNRSYNEDHWRRVTAVYDRAWATGWPPTRAVAEQFGVTRSTAAKWVSNCRKKGLLPPTQKTRPRGNPVNGEADGVGNQN